MTQMNPITGSIMQAPGVQRGQDMDKARQMCHAQEARKNTAASEEEEVEESVSSADALPEVGDEHQNRQKRNNTYGKRRPSEPEIADEGDNLDLTA